MDKKFRALVYTTPKDLPESWDVRGLITLTLMDLNGMPVPMDDYNTDKLQRGVVQKFLQDSDYVFLVIADRVGRVRMKDLESMAWASSYGHGIGKTVIPIIYKEANIFKETTGDPKSDEYKRTFEFKKFLEQQACVTWTSLSDLETNLRSIVSKVIAADPPIGYVRGNTAVSRIAAMESERKDNVIAKQEFKIKTLEASPDRARTSSEEGKKPFEIRFKFKVGDEEPWHSSSFELPLDDIFAYDSLFLMNQSADPENKKRLEHFIVERVKATLEQHLIYIGKELHTFTMFFQNYLKLMAKFQKLEWVEIRDKSSDKKTIRGLTSSGTDHMYELVL